MKASATSQILRAIRLANSLNQGEAPKNVEVRVGYIQAGRPSPHYARVLIDEKTVAHAGGATYDAALDQLVLDLQATVQGRLASLTEALSRDNEGEPHV